MNRRIVSALLLFPLLSTFSWGAGPTERKAQDFKINMVDGSKVSLGQYQGKVVVLAMIMTTCPHCQAATRILATLQKEFGPKGLQVLEAALDQKPAESVPVFIKNFNPPFPVGYTTVAESVAFMQLSSKKRYYVPYVTFIDRDGMIRGQYVGDDPFNAEKAQTANSRAMVTKLVNGKDAARK